ncbi:MAG: glycosyltransferase, partial [Terriglobia bacterium]
LGTSRTLYRRSYKAERVARELDNLLGKPQYALKAGEIGARLRSENGAATASDLIEEFLTGFQKKETANEDFAYASRN